MSIDILDGYGKCVFRFIKEMVDYIDKNNEEISVIHVINGVITISNVYCMLLTENFSETYATSITNRAITIYIDFIVQISGIDTSVNVNWKIGSRDAAQFVYKKLLSNVGNPKSTSEKSAEGKKKSGDEVSEGDEKKQVNTNLVLYLDKREVMNTLHLYKCVLRNIISALFTKKIFYDEKTQTTEYYSHVIKKMLVVNNHILTKLSNAKQFEYVVGKQYDNGNNGINDIAGVNDYIDWVLYTVNTVC